MRRILEKIKNLPIFQQGKPTQELINLQFQLNLKDTQTQEMQTTIDELQKTIALLGIKDQERATVIQTLNKDNIKLAELNTTLTTKIATMRQDMQTQANFMICVNDAIHTMLTGLTKLPDTMPSLDPNFHNDTPLSNKENPPEPTTPPHNDQELN